LPAEKEEEERKKKEVELALEEERAKERAIQNQADLQWLSSFPLTDLPDDLLGVIASHWSPSQVLAHFISFHKLTA